MTARDDYPALAAMALLPVSSSSGTALNDALDEIDRLRALRAADQAVIDAAYALVAADQFGETPGDFGRALMALTRAVESRRAVREAEQ